MSRFTVVNRESLNTAEISGSTKIVAMLGDPIAQVRTPQAINPLFQAAGANIVCMPLRVSAENLRVVWDGLRAISNVIGFTVTLPHKQNALCLCDSLDEQAERVGAVNVVRREADGEMRGYQFDGRGFIGGLAGQGHSLKGRDCLLVGAGGSARAIAIALLDAGIRSITIYNRTRKKAEALADQINSRSDASVAAAGAPDAVDNQLIINATSLGMRDDDPLPMPTDRINSTMLVAEVVANPAMTRFLEEAKRRGAAVHSGEHMVRNQVSLIANHFMAAASS